MNALILAGLMSLFTPDDGPPAPLHITTLPAGAQVIAQWGKGSNVGEERCLTPCTVTIPARAVVRLYVVKDGKGPLSMPPVAWKNTSKGWALRPASLDLEMPANAP